MIVSACDGDVLCFTGVYTHFRYRVDKSMRNLKIIKFMHLRTTILVVCMVNFTITKWNLRNDVNYLGLRQEQRSAVTDGIQLFNDQSIE